MDHKIVGLVTDVRLIGAIRTGQPLTLSDDQDNTIYFVPTKRKGPFLWLGFVDTKPARFNWSLFTDQSLIWY